jgi:hypothetical protein
MSVFFNGRLYTTPATMSLVDDSAMFNKNLTVGNIHAIIGKSEGGKPATALRFGNHSEAKAVLRSGEALKAIEKAFDPSAETGSPAEIVFIRVNPATQSALTLLDASAGDSIALTSEDYGLYTKGLRVKVEAGSVSGKKVSTGFGDDYYTQDNLERKAFSIQYSGGEATGAITITETTVTVAAGATNTEIDLTVYDTISKLVDRINNITGFSATVLDGNHEKPALKGLDGLTAQDVKTALYTVKGDLQAIIDWINSASEGYMTATRPTGALKVPANIAWTYLAGGSDGSVTNTEWQAAFDALQSVDAQWITPISPTAAIHAMADTHCAYMSNIGRKERRCLVGGDTGVSDADAITAAKALNSDRTSYVHLGFYDYNDAGVLTLYPPYILAAMLGGMLAGVNPGTALTNKAIKVRGLERKLRNPTDTDQLINGGVLCVEDTEDGYKVVQSITTWLINNHYNRREVSVGAAVDFTIRNVRQAVDVLRGKKATPALLTEAISLAQTALDELARPEPMGPGILVGDAESPAYKNIQASIDGDVLRIEFQASPVIPANYIPIVMHAVPFRGSASA